MATELQDWRKNILEQLEKRKIKEANPFQELINSHGELLRGFSVYKLRNSELELQTYQLKQEILELQGRIAVGGNGSFNSDKELKIYKLQEELTELHRTKGEHAQKIIQLTIDLKAKDDLILQKDLIIRENQNQMDSVLSENGRLNSLIADLDAANQAIKDEHQALQMLCNSTEEKYKNLQFEYQELVQRCMHQKALEADLLNMQNEVLASRRQQKLQQELIDAANEPIFLPPVSLSPENGKRSSSYSSLGMICLTSVPDRPTQSTEKNLEKGYQTFWFYSTLQECHEGEVMTVRFSPSGKYFVTGGSDRKVKIWEIDGRGAFKELATLTGCRQSVTCTRFDLLEKLILASSNDNACWIWSINDLRLRHTLTGHSNKVMTAKFLGTDSSKIASGSYDRTIKVWDLRSKVCTKTIFAGSSCNDLVTSDIAGTTIISGHFDKKIRFWDIRCDQNSNEIQLQGKVASLDLSQDMNYLLACTRDDSLKLIDLRRNQIVSTYRTDGFKVAFDYTRACFSPDAQYALCGSHDNNIYVWNTRTNQLDKVLKEHKSAVIATAWHPHGSSILSSDKNKHVILWNDF
ncbi:autophagy-related protein 16-1 isoform X4 [Hydra vulgaris]|uniref:autophagy-related protein 16-1 isoform X4 n=1 Tax=Hydra vulgaris TaxID=6087 RepID=UPI001F5FEB2B|nr:autophagy-related protein 16-1 isoform X1 [Hydra vulgaris]